MVEENRNINVQTNISQLTKKSEKPSFKIYDKNGKRKRIKSFAKNSEKKKEDLRIQPIFHIKKMFYQTIALEFMYGLFMSYFFFLMMGNTVWRWTGLVFYFDFFAYLFMRFKNQELVFSTTSTLIMFCPFFIFCIRYLFYSGSFAYSFINFHKQDRIIVDCIAIIIQSKFKIFTILDFFNLYYFIILIKKIFNRKKGSLPFNLFKIDEIGLVGCLCNFLRMLVLSVIVGVTQSSLKLPLAVLFFCKMLYLITTNQIHDYENKYYMRFNKIFKREFLSFFIICVLQRFILEHYAILNFNNNFYFRTMFDSQFFSSNLMKYLFK